MSNIFVTNIVGSGTYAVPSTDAALASATSGLDTLIDAIANLDYSRVLAWVETEDGGSASRTLNCMIEQFSYVGEECPDSTETEALTLAIYNKLMSDGDISAVGSQQVHIFAAGAYFLWSRNAASGYLYPTTTTDDVAVGAGPDGMWFNDGDLVLGAAAMSGGERFRVVNAGARIEKADSAAENALYVQVATSHPAAHQAVVIDADVNSIALDIDSEATSKPLINLQPVVGNTRGDIAFGTVRTSDPSTPTEGDVWYNSTENCLRYYNGTVSICASPGGFGNFYAYNSDNTLSTTTSTTYQQKLRLSVTDVDAGTYRIAWCFTYYRAGNAARDFEARVQIDDSTTIWYIMANENSTATDMRYPAMGFIHTSLTAASHDIDLDFRIAAGGGTATAGIDNVRLEIWKVS